MRNEAKTKLAMCWYDEAQWRILKELDPDALDDSYETWRRNANLALREMVALGHRIAKVDIRIESFLHWCNEHDVEPNGQSRSAYAAWVLRRRDGEPIH